MTWKYKKTFAVISFFILIALYWNREFFISNFYWVVHSPKEFMGKMEPKYPSWYASRYSEWGKPDTNNNGIRDDVEIRINRMMNDLSKTEIVIMYNKLQMVQSSLVPVDDKEDFADRYWERSNSLFECQVFYSKYYNLLNNNKYKFYTERFKKGRSIYKKLKDILFNSSERRDRFEIFLDKFHGRGNFSHAGIKFVRLVQLEEDCGISGDIAQEIRRILFKHNIKLWPKYMSNRKGAIDEIEKEYGTKYRYRYNIYTPSTE